MHIAVLLTKSKFCWINQQKNPQLYKQTKPIKCPYFVVGAKSFRQLTSTILFSFLLHRTTALHLDCLCLEQLLESGYSKGSGKCCLIKGSDQLKVVFH